ncbi:SUEL-type lectin domain-containing protein [Caenorhabditis elegans]|uniref:SUEL-type lectin domain-containing protein n=2 Tax=Caenorhabditis elegans TaxID=6239 RepID=A0A131MCP4_CAEEL|nr:SUEL-type lectin domain-containing protein [Caenorhabditis elegans]CZR14432.1 SUEL-type lectin domain-containing protein [Caenorhabditis elegans]|eukprot:NP_001309519.1 Protein eva-1 [Caenorhabditis elegans]
MNMHIVSPVLLLFWFGIIVTDGKLKSGFIGGSHHHEVNPIEAALLVRARLGILRESLRSNRVQACDGERITLSCPRNTQISVQTGFYGRVVPENQLCPPQAGRKHSEANLDPLSMIHHSSTCDVIQAHTRISELCDKRRKCTVVVDSNTFEDDPCPTTSKYLQMAYGCIPMSFDEETFCTPKPTDPPRPEIRLECREGRRLAVYSAQMKTSPQCDPETEIRHECVSDVLPQVLRQCHAKEGCTLKSDGIKGHCRHGHLHVVYVCVNEEIFSEEAIKGELTSLETYLKEADAMQKQDDERFFKDVNDKTQWERVVDSEPAKDPDVHQIANDASYVTHDEYRMEKQDPPPITERVEPNLVGVGHDLLQVVQFFKENKEKAVMCIVLAVSMAAIVVLSACIITRLCSSNKDSSRSSRRSRSRRSLETSKLVSSNYGGSITPQHMMQDIEDEQFLRFSMGSAATSNPHYSHYDF